MTELVYYTCPGPVSRDNKRTFILESEVVQIRDLELVAERDAKFCTFLFNHSRTGAKFKVESLNLTLSG